MVVKIRIAKIQIQPELSLTAKTTKNSLFLPFLLRLQPDGWHLQNLLSICKDLLYRMAITFQKLFYISKGLKFLIAIQKQKI